MTSATKLMCQPKHKVNQNQQTNNSIVSIPAKHAHTPAPTLQPINSKGTGRYYFTEIQKHSYTPSNQRIDTYFERLRQTVATMKSRRKALPAAYTLQDLFPGIILTASWQQQYRQHAHIVATFQLSGGEWMLSTCSTSHSRHIGHSVPCCHS